MKSKLYSLTLKQIIFNLAIAVSPALMLVSAAFATKTMPDWGGVAYVAGGSVVSALVNIIRQFCSDEKGEFLPAKAETPTP